MADRPTTPKVEQPRSEPEIIPPGRTHEAEFRGAWARVFIDEDGTRRIRVAKIGPLGIALMSLAVGAVAAVVLLVMLGIFLIWIPVVGLIVASLMISTWLRAYFRRPR